MSDDAELQFYMQLCSAAAGMLGALPDRRAGADPELEMTLQQSVGRGAIAQVEAFTEITNVRR